MSKTEIPEVVISSIKNSFPTDSEEIIKQLRYDSINRCYFFSRWGMYIGVESDGYIHS